MIVECELSRGGGDVSCGKRIEEGLLVRDPTGALQRIGGHHGAQIAFVVIGAGQPVLTGRSKGVEISRILGRVDIRGISARLHDSQRVLPHLGEDPGGEVIVGHQTDVGSQTEVGHLLGERERARSGEEGIGHIDAARIDLADEWTVVGRAQRRLLLRNDLATGGGEGVGKSANALLTDQEVPGKGGRARLAQLGGGVPPDHPVLLAVGQRGTEDIRTAVRTGCHLRPTNRKHQGNLFRGGEFGDGRHDRGIDDAHEQADLLFADETAGLVERLLRIARGVGKDQLDRMPGHRIVDRIEIELDTGVDLFAENGERARGRVQHANLDRLAGCGRGILGNRRGKPGHGKPNREHEHQESFHLAFSFEQSRNGTMVQRPMFRIRRTGP